MEKLGKAAKNILIVGIPIALIAGAIIALYNSNPAKYQLMIQEMTGQFPVHAENDLVDWLRGINGARNISYVISSAQHATTPARHRNPFMSGRAIDMWCVVVDPPSELIGAGNRPLRSFLIYQTQSGGRWVVATSLDSERADFEDVGCTNYQP